MTVKLDVTKLLGFRISSSQSAGGKVGGKPNMIKTGGKVGGKPFTLAIKTGAKVGAKEA